MQERVPAVITGSDGSIYTSIRKLALTVHMRRSTISDILKAGGSVVKNGVTYNLATNIDSNTPVIDNEELASDFQEFLKMKQSRDLRFETYNFDIENSPSGDKYAIALFSDAHIEETVDAESVMGLNEYSISIAEQRIRMYFRNLVSCLNNDGVDYLVFASLGDTISGFIHEELSQMNSLTPFEATLKAQSLIYSGLEYIYRNSDVQKIKFIGIVGNHSRTTKKIQHANGYKLSYEWLMYQNLKEYCELTNLPVEFDLPSSEMTVLDMFDGRRFLFIHGYQVHGGGTNTVCGIYPALNRLSMKWDKIFHQDKIYLGHFHSCVSIPNATVNGSIIGYNAYSLSNGFPYEEPAQMYEMWDSNRGLLCTRKIYCK